MNLRTALLSIGLCVALAPLTFAADKELVMLHDGRSGMAEILETTPDSVSVRFTKDGTQIETKIRAERLDPVSFYGLRKKHMESTAENHVRLAVFCAEQGLFNQARYEMKLARTLDPEIDKKIDTSPKIKEGIAKRLGEAARAHYDKGEYQVAYELVQVIATRFGDTSLGPKAEEALGLIEAKMAEVEAAEVAKRKKKIADAADEAAKKAAQARDEVVSKLEKHQDEARKKTSRALRTRGKNDAKNLFDQVGDALVRLLKEIEAARGNAGGDAELVAELDDLRKEVESEAINAYLNAGNIVLEREAFNNADEYAAKAEAIAPGNGRVQSFKNAILASRAENADFDEFRRGGRRR